MSELNKAIEDKKNTCFKCGHPLIMQPKHGVCLATTAHGICGCRLTSADIEHAQLRKLADHCTFMLQVIDELHAKNAEMREALKEISSL